MTVLPYKDQEEGKKEQVRGMFNNIARRYDLLNRVLSGGIDIIWRKKAVGKLKEINPKRILDIATGTADFALEAVKLNPDKIIGVDIAEKMLEIGREKITKAGLSQKIELFKGDSESLQFQDNEFDAVIVSFGVRNFENLENGLAEMFRVLRPGGKVVILEFSQPEKFPFRQLVNFYYRILPSIGKLISKDKAAYKYLPDSVQKFPYGKAFATILEKTGFKSVQVTPLTFGICSIYTGIKG